MLLQGDLQVVFDALYSIGAIDPVLNMDWEVITKEMERHPEILHSACNEINLCHGHLDMMVEKLHRMDKTSINFVALEVAREFSEFQSRETLH